MSRKPFGLDTVRKLYEYIVICKHNDKPCEPIGRVMRDATSGIRGTPMMRTTSCSRIHPGGLNIFAQRVTLAGRCSMLDWGNNAVEIANKQAHEALAAPLWQRFIQWLLKKRVKKCSK